MNEELQITRRHLPQRILKEVTYFVTFRVVKEEKLSIEEQTLVLKHLKDGNGKFYTLIAGVVMYDSVHLLFVPMKRYSLRNIFKGSKGYQPEKLS